MAALQPIDFYSIAFPNSPNPWKVAIVLEELHIPYKIHLESVFSVKRKPFTDLNPNGRTPVIVDHNNGGLVLWESVAIIQYLVDRYDTDHRLSYPDAPEKYYINQWLIFQASGQGVYFGQAIWFSHMHVEIFPSAISRYRSEIRRVLSVLNTALEGRQYLVGDKLTIADLAFVPWNHLIPFAAQEDTEKVTKGFPNVDAWMARMMQLESVKMVLEEKRGEMSKPLPAPITGVIKTVQGATGLWTWLTGGHQTRESETKA